MKKSTLVAAAVLAAAGSAASADVYSFSFAVPNPITNTVSSFSIDTTGASGRARAFYVTGDWTAAGGDPWSNEFRVRLDGVTDVLGPLERIHGGVNNGSPFTFTDPTNTTWVNNVTNPVGYGYNTMLANAASSDLGGMFTLGLRQSFAGSQASLANAQIHFLTDVIAPVAFDSAASGLSMPARPTSLTTTTTGAGGGYTYDAMSFTPLVSGAHHLAMHISPPFDGYLLVYQGAFDPNAPLVNLIGIDDIGGLGDPNSADMFLGLTAGQEYTLVATTFSAGSALRVSGLFTIAGPVPAPGAVALAGLAALGGLSRRRRN
ncbi:MAG: hypothetical protein KF866_04300 [Phycisphaeraceae bacterium]|nr:hypothetical protein [Phycisphaeraceae bacterium]MCW5753096.1 hypothetical protein [Phycisphaeraceae bacterium]